MDYKPLLVTSPESIPSGDVVIAATPAAEAGDEAIALGRPGGRWLIIDNHTFLNKDHSKERAGIRQTHRAWRR